MANNLEQAQQNSDLQQDRIDLGNSFIGKANPVLQARGTAIVADATIKKAQADNELTVLLDP